MLKLRIRIPHVAGAAAALSFAGMATGCAAEVDDMEAASDELTLAQAGTGAIRFQGFALQYASTSGGDEFIRSGETLTAELSYDELTYLFDYADRAGLTPSNVKVVAKITYLDGAGATVSTANANVTWSTGTGGQRVGTSTKFKVPKKVPAMKVDFQVTGAGKTFLASEKSGSLKTFPVFGAYLPSKLALFDNEGNGARRTRVVEFGNLVRNANATMSYTDWRADGTVDRMRLDTKIGQRQTGGRFGPVLIDAYGEVEYEIEAAYTTDGVNWKSARLDKHVNAAVVQMQGDPRRASYEATIVPAGSDRELRVAFHVKAFLKVNYNPGELVNPRYAPGTRLQLADVWDNNGGNDYRVPVAAR